MSDVNSVTLTGRLTKDPELRTTSTDTSIASFGIAVEGYKKDADEQPVNFFDVSVFGNFADVIVNKARKGDKVTLAGRLEQRKWETDAGEKRSAVGIVARDLVGEFLYRKADGSDTPARQEGAAVQEAIPVAAAAAPSDDDIPF